VRKPYGFPVLVSAFGLFKFILMTAQSGFQLDAIA